MRGTRKEAEAHLSRWISEVESGLAVEGKDLLARDYLTEWIRSKWIRVQQGQLKARTVTEYAHKIELHIAPVIGHIPLRRVRPQDIESVYNEAFARGLSATTVLHIHRILSQALKQATRWQMVPRNVAESVEPPVAKRTSIQHLVPSEVRSVLNLYRGTDLEHAVSLALGTGLRLGEVFGLRWSDIDLQSRLLHVHTTLQIDGSFSSPKSIASNASISLSQLAIDALKKRRTEQHQWRLRVGSAWNDLDLVFDRGDGAPVRTQNISRRFSAIARAAGLPYTFHSLRHAHASLMHAAGADMKTLSRHMRHATYQITADLYTHPDFSQEQRAVERFDDYWLASHPPNL